MSLHKICSPVYVHLSEMTNCFTAGGEGCLCSTGVMELNLWSNCLIVITQAKLLAFNKVYFLQ